jgi:MFS family permease
LLSAAGISNPVLPYLAKSYALSDSDQGLFVAAPLITGFLASIFAGRLADKFGRRPLFFLADLAFLLAAALGSLSPGFGYVLASRFIAGIGGQ